MLSKLIHRHTTHFIHRAHLMAAGAILTGFTVVSSPKQESASHSSSIRIANPLRHRSQALCESLPPQETEQQRFDRTLAYHRAKIAEYRSRWEYKMPGSESSASTLTSTVTPSRSWPDDIPPDDMLPMLLNDIQYCARSPNFRSDTEYCNRLRFRVASALIVQFDEEQQKLGLEMLRNLAENGYCDAMTYYGMFLNEGRAGMDPNPVGAVFWFRRCHDMYEHSQSQYELGVAYYTGEGVVEDGEAAVGWFLCAAEKDHPAAW